MTVSVCNEVCTLEAFLSIIYYDNYLLNLALLMNRLRMKVARTYNFSVYLNSYTPRESNRINEECVCACSEYKHVVVAILCEILKEDEFKIETAASAFTPPPPPPSSSTDVWPHT